MRASIRLTLARSRKNVLLGVPGGREVVEAAAWRANLDSDLEAMSDDLRTELGTGGSHLSGGRLQRVALARILARPAELLVMDDVSSALDGPTEEEFWRRLLDTGSGQTYLMVSNRRSVLERADRVVLLSEGSAASAGTLADVLDVSAENRALCAEDPEPPVSPR